MSKPIWMPFYPADYLTDTTHLTTVQHGAYVLLLLQCWLNGGTLPKDEGKLARIARMHVSEWQDYGPDVLAYFTDAGDCLRHKRVDVELAKAEAFREEQVRKGKLSAQARLNRGSTVVQPEHQPEGQPKSTKSQSQSQSHIPSPTSLRSVVLSQKPDPKGSRIDPAWTPSPDLIAWAAREVPDIDIKTEHAKFIDYWTGKAGAAARKADWPSTWRNWMRRAIETTKGTTHAGKSTSTGSFAALTRNLGGAAPVARLVGQRDGLEEHGRSSADGREPRSAVAGLPGGMLLAGQPARGSSEVSILPELHGAGSIPEPDRAKPAIPRKQATQDRG